MIFDGHSDLLYDVTRRRLAGEKHVLERHHLRNLEAGGVEGLALALWVSAGQGQTFWKDVPEAVGDRERTDIMLLCMKAELAECPWLALVRTPALGWVCSRGRRSTSWPPGPAAIRIPA